MKTTGYFGPPPIGRPRIFAHRGLSFRDNRLVADENTLLAFELALAAGADYLESDIQVSKDGIPVLFHDSDLRRLIGKKQDISDLSLRELEEIRLPLGGRIPSLAEALVSFPDAKFNLDLKTPSAEVRGIEVIEQHGASNRVLVSSFNEQSRLRALAIARYPIATSAGSSRVLSAYLAARLGRQAAFGSQLADVDALQLPLRRFGIDFTHPGFLERLSELDVELHYWTINDVDLMRSLYRMGAHGIVTDRTDLAVAAF
jgi:glycerophosphoryl diester phosphodiesterase